MRKAMTYPIRFWAIVLTGLLLYQFSSQVAADSCKYKKEIDLKLDLSSSEILAIRAAAGDLDVVGVSGSDQAVIHGEACASKEEWLEQTSIETSAGRNAEISVNIPDTDGGWSLIGNNYVYVDLSIKVPDDISLNIKDSSGDMFLRNTAALEIGDSSGDIEIEDALGTISISDSSGDIEIEGADGDITIESDSSGDINAVDVNGNVLVKKDSSGDIDVSDVSKDVVVERDSSGDISASDVGGDFRVLKDGSGSIDSRNITGEIDIPEKD